MRRRIVFSVASLIAVLATPSTTTPPEFKDDAEAVRLAAEQGHASAQYNLGAMYEIGRGVPEDDAEPVVLVWQAWENKAMVRKQGLVPIGEALADLGGPVKSIREVDPRSLAPGVAPLHPLRPGPFIYASIKDTSCPIHIEILPTFIGFHS